MYQIICTYQRVQLSEFSQTKHTKVTSNQFKKQNIINSPQNPPCASLLLLCTPTPPTILLLRIKIVSLTLFLMSIELYNKYSFVSSFFTEHCIVRIINVALCNRSFFLQYSILLCIHYTVDGHLGSSRFGATTHRASMNIPAPVFGIHRHTFLLHINLEVKKLYYGICTFDFRRCCQIDFPKDQFTLPLAM